MVKRWVVTTTGATKEAPTNQRDTLKKVTLDTLQRPPVIPEDTLQRPPVIPEDTPQRLPVTPEDILQNQLTEVTAKRGVILEVTPQNQPVTTVTGDVTKMYLKKEGRSQTCFLLYLFQIDP